MKTLKSLFIIAALLLTFQVKAQLATFQTDSRSKIAPLNLAISYLKTTNLIFPFTIKSVDRGSAEVLVQKAVGIENVLQVKAAKDSFQQTNLTVITADGFLYSFLLHYSAEPTTLNLQLSDRPMGYEPLAIFTASRDNQEKILTISELVSAKMRTLKGPGANKHDVAMSLMGIFIKDNLLYFQFQLDNNSNISYDIDQFRFFIIDKKKSKRTAAQQLEQVPINIYGNATVLHEQSTQHLVVALEKFTIPDSKNLIIQMGEKNGGRHLSLKVTNQLILSAIPIQ